MADERLRIGDLAKAAATKVETIRYYERIGLLRPADRTPGNYRTYGPRDRERLSFIRHARELGLSLPAIRDLLRLADDPEHPCDDADKIVRLHLNDVERRLGRLAALKSELELMLTRCEGGRRIAECRVIEALADHGSRRGVRPDGPTGRPPSDSGEKCRRVHDRDPDLP